MATKCFGSVKARVVRATLLDACGVPVVGASSTVTSEGFIKVDPKFEYEDGTEFVQKNAWGDLCINQRDQPRLKRVGLDVDFCKVDPALFSMFTGWRELTAGGDTLGLAANFDEVDIHVALETWSLVAGGACSGGDTEWVYWLWPELVNGKMKDFSLGLSTATFGITAETGTVENEWDSGPYATAPLPVGISIGAGEPFAFGVTTTAPPAATCGAVALAALGG